MPKLRAAISPHLAERPFHVSEARAAELGRRALQGAQFSRPYRGVRVFVPPSGSGSAPAGSGDARARSGADLRAWQAAIGFAPLLRNGEAFSHETALLLHGCPIRADDRHHVAIPKPKRGRRAVGIVGHATSQEFTPELLVPPPELRGAPGLRDIRWDRYGGGLPVVPAAFALRQAAPDLPVQELVVALDALGQREWPSDAWLGRLRAEFAESHGRGVAKLRRAADLARVGSESRMETMLRLLLEEQGLAEHFDLQVELYDDAGWIGRFDLVALRERVVLEYDGEQHRLVRSQYLHDLRRLERVQKLGFTVIRVHWEMLFEQPAQLIGTVMQALDTT